MKRALSSIGIAAALLAMGGTAIASGSGAERVVKSRITIGSRHRPLDYDCGSPRCFTTIFRGRVLSRSAACRRNRRGTLRLDAGIDHLPNGIPAMGIRVDRRGRWRTRMTGGDGGPHSPFHIRFFAHLRPKRVDVGGATILCAGDRSRAVS